MNNTDNKARKHRPGEIKSKKRNKRSGSNKLKIPLKYTKNIFLKIDIF